MSGYNFDRPFIRQDAIQAYVATNRCCTEIPQDSEGDSAVEHRIQDSLWSAQTREQHEATAELRQNLSWLPRCPELNTPAQYETWMPDDAF